MPRPTSRWAVVPHSYGAAWPVTRCITDGPEVHTTPVNHPSSASPQETLEAATSAT